MAAPRVTMFLQVGRFGWSEAHYAMGANTVDDARPLATELCTARSKILGKGASIEGVRISMDDVFRDSRVILKEQLGPQEQNTTANAVAGVLDTPDRVHTALLVRAEAGTRHRKSIYLAGYPDNNVTELGGTHVYDPQPAFRKAITAYFIFLTNLNTRWGFRTRKNELEGAPQFPVKSAVLDNVPPGSMGVKVAAGTFVPAVNDRVQLSGFKMLRGAGRSANGIFQVENYVAGANGADDTIFLRHSGDIDPNGIEIYGKVQKVLYQVLAYDSMEVVTATHRKRGGRTTLPLGRARTRK